MDDKTFWEHFIEPFKGTDWKAVVKTLAYIITPLVSMKYFYADEKVLWIIPEGLFLWLTLAFWSFKIYDGFKEQKDV